MGEKIEDDESRYLFGEFGLQEEQKYRIIAGRGGISFWHYLVSPKGWYGLTRVVGRQQAERKERLFLTGNRTWAEAGRALNPNH